MNELDMAAIQRRVGSARTWAALQVDLDDSKLPPNLIEHFDRDVPALVDAVRRLEQANAELIAVLDATRARMREAEAAREWVVARDGGRHCERCEGQIQRGHAYEGQPGAGGLLQHIHCPDEVTAR